MQPRVTLAARATPAPAPGPWDSVAHWTRAAPASQLRVLEVGKPPPPCQPRPPPLPSLLLNSQSIWFPRANPFEWRPLGRRWSVPSRGLHWRTETTTAPAHRPRTHGRPTVQEEALCTIRPTARERAVASAREARTKEWCWPACRGHR